MNSSFPTMLKNKATFLGSLTRFDLIILGCVFMILSIIEVSSLVALLINVTVLILIKFLQKKLPKGFFRLVKDDTHLPWAYKLEDINNE